MRPVVRPRVKTGAPIGNFFEILEHLATAGLNPAAKTQTIFGF